MRYIFQIVIAVLLFVCMGSGCATGDQVRRIGEDIPPERASGFRDVPLTRAKNAMVVSAHPLASEAGRRVLRQGGSALDAAIATQAMLSLVEPQSSGIGGGGFLLYYDAKAKKLIAYDGRETAPAKATGDLFLDANGRPLDFYDAVVGGRSVGTPGLVRMLELAHGQHGQRPWSTLFADAITQAKQGFTVTPRLARLIQLDKHLARETEARRYFFDAEGRPLRAGAVLKNPQLAQTLRAIANRGADALYTGAIAKDIITAVHGHANSGVLELDDLAAYRAKVREPVCVKYRGYRVCGMPPPTSGGVTTLQILKLLEPFDLGDDPQSPDFLHLLAEAERLAYADRDLYLADPDHVRVPTDALLSDVYLKARSTLIQPDRATPNAKAGQPSNAPSRGDAEAHELPSTTHLVVVDKTGNIACMTSSIENVFGSRVMVRGFLLNNQLTDFSFRPTDKGGRPIANAVAARKRPRSSMSPVMVFDHKGNPVLAVGSPGGSRIIGYVAQTLLHVLDFRLDVQRAIDLPRFVNRNGKTEVEDHPEHRAAIDLIIKNLTTRGHTVTRGELNSGIHAIGFTKQGIEGGIDPRREGVALGD